MKKQIFTIILLACSFMASMAQIAYHDAAQFPLLGKGVQESTNRYCRLPDSLKNMIRKPLWNLGCNSAGMAVRFSSNSSKIAAKWSCEFLCNMNHMTATGIRGLDLYCMLPDSTWTFVGSARPRVGEKDNSVTIISDMEPIEREYMLYLSLYDGVNSLQIGVDSLANISVPKINLPEKSNPIVFYGTSIMQGGCASRPGMCHTNILSRWLNREVFNFGFSGNAHLDLEIADVVGSIPAALIILDFVPNTTVEKMDSLMVKFYHRIRAKQPTVPIMFIENPMFPHMRFNNKTNKSITERNKALRRNYSTLVASGEKNIYYLEGNNILGNDSEATVDGDHFTDLGFLRYSQLLYPLIKGVAK